ncbi:MAG: hypothetical protein DRI57_07040, partial [Deltaproteobacteria bacterium]
MEKGIFTRFAIIGLMICGMMLVASPQAMAQVTDLTVSDITETTATFKAIFQTQTADGFCWDTSQNPTKDNCLGFTEDLTGLFIQYEGNASGLNQGTTYYVAGYGTIGGSPVYSESVSFTTEGTGGNAAPTDISLGSTSVSEGKSSGTAVGTFSTTDADSGDTHTYTLTDGEGGYDNDSFAISGDTLETAAIFDYDVKNSYLIFVQTDDGNGGTFQKEFTITVIKSPPGVTFDPADGATGLAVDTDITITFSEAVRFTDDSEVTSSNADALITLKKDNAAGADVSFDASINAGKTMITIVPDANLDDGQTYYAAIEADLEGEADNAISATSASFTTLSANAPTLTFSPTDGTTDVAVDASITIAFSEAVRLLDDSEITNSNADGLITLKKDSAVGTNMAFDASINAGKTMITITPNANFDNEQAYYVAIGASVENDSDAAIAAGSATFTTVSASAAPTVTFFPADGATGVAAGANITITFDKPVRLIDDSTLTDSNADGLI